MPPTARLSGTLGNVRYHTSTVPDRGGRALRRDTLVSESLPVRRSVKYSDMRQVDFVEALATDGRTCEADPKRIRETAWSALTAMGNSRIDSPETGSMRSEEHTSELQSLMRISYAVFCLKQ